MSRKKGYFSISAVAKMFSVQQQTIRLYEKQGLINPKRTDGNTRMFTEEDVEKLEEVIYLTHKLGINLAGVEMILKLQRQIKKLQREVNQVFEETDKELSRHVIASKREAQQAVQQLIDRQPAAVACIEAEQKNDLTPIVDIDTWEIEYDD